MDKTMSFVMVAMLAVCMFAGCATGGTVAAVAAAEKTYVWPEPIMTATVNGVGIRVETKYISNPPDEIEVIRCAIASLQQQIRGHKAWHKAQETDN